MKPVNDEGYHIVIVPVLKLKISINILAECTD